MKKIKLTFYILLIALITSCGSRHRYNIYDLQEVKDRNNFTISSNWGNGPTDMKPFSYDGELYNVKMYMDDPAYDKLGFSPYRNNAAIYKNYYEKRKGSWKTLWGLLN
jgi:hypothetical protein